MAGRSDMSSYFHSLRIYSPLYNDDKTPGRLGKGYPWTRNNEHFLLGSNSGTNCLETILCDHLTNCRSFFISPNALLGDYEKIDGRNSKPSYSPDWLTPLDAVTILFHIASRKELAIRDFHILSRLPDLTLTWYEDYQPPPKPMTSFGFPMEMTLDTNRFDISNLKSDAFRNAWAYVQDFTLRVQTSRFNAQIGDREQAHKQSLEIIERLLSPASKLRALNLSLSGYVEPEKPDTMKLLNSDDRCANLTDLSLSRIDFTSDSVLKLLSCCCGTLRRLELIRVKITVGRSWAEIIDEMRTFAHNLQIIHLFQLKDQSGPILNEYYGWKAHTVYFQGIFGEDALPDSEAMGFKLDNIVRKGVKRPTAVYYKGSKMDEALEFISRSIIVVDP
jgi:hypothetical protein